jgi:hypothetical protein
MRRSSFGAASTVSDMDEEQQADLFIDYLFGVTSDADEELLQTWHDEHRHAETDPLNGPCFCCCESCDPD